MHSVAHFTKDALHSCDWHSAENVDKKGADAFVAWIKHPEEKKPVVSLAYL